MTLIDKIKQLYPELTDLDFRLEPFGTRLILLQNDSDGRGDYIKEWNHPTLLKPTDEQLNSI